jgi:hypothetical protein
MMIFFFFFCSLSSMMDFSRIDMLTMDTVVINQYVIEESPNHWRHTGRHGRDAFQLALAGNIIILGHGRYSALSLKHLGQHSRLVVSIGRVWRSADSLLGRDDGVELDQSRSSSSSSSSHDTSNGLDTEGQQKRGCPIQKEQIDVLQLASFSDYYSSWLDRTGWSPARWLRRQQQQQPPPPPPPDWWWTRLDWIGLDLWSSLPCRGRSSSWTERKKERSSWTYSTSLGIRIDEIDRYNR